MALSNRVIILGGAKLLISDRASLTKVKKIREDLKMDKPTLDLSYCDKVEPSKLSGLPVEILQCYVVVIS